MTNEQYLKNLEVPTGKVDIILDTDAYNEIDDQYAISLMLKSPEKFNVKAITAAPFFNANSTSPKDGMERSYSEIKKLISLIGSDFTDVYEGSTDYLKDEKTPIISDASEKIVEIAKHYSPTNPLYVVAIGCITNVASALLTDESIAENIVIVWLGGHDIHWKNTDEFNMEQDIAAARVVFSSKSPLVQLPCMGVVSSVTTTKYELQYWLDKKNPLCSYLYQHTVEEAESYAKGKPWSRVIWDVTTIFWFFGKGFEYKIIAAPTPEYDRTYSFNGNTKKIGYVNYIDRDAVFEKLFETLVK